MELSKEQLKSELAKANVIINKLQAKIGQSEGYIAKLETENEFYRTNPFSYTKWNVIAQRIR